jgi:hypothetical protein
MKKVVGLAALFAAGLALAGGLASVGVADITTTETLPVTTTVEQTTTTPAETLVTTLERTTTREVTTTPLTGTTTSSSSSTSTPTWVWVVLAILAAAVVGLVVALLARRGRGVPDGERQRRLEAAVASWTTQGWALESQRPGEAILRRGSELMAVGIDDKGQITTRPLSS